MSTKRHNYQDCHSQEHTAALFVTGAASTTQLSHPSSACPLSSLLFGF